MKISDAELMQAIWEYQIKKIAQAVAHKYVPTSYGLCPDEPFWYSSACHIHYIDRKKVTSAIHPQQLLSRIRNLIKEGAVQDIRNTGFMIHNRDSMEAFKKARAWWEAKGLRDGYNTDGSSRTIELRNFDELKAECQEYLLSAFPRCRKMEEPSWSP